MEKTTQKEIKRLIRLGAAKEITECGTPATNELDTVAMPFGIYGMNGAIFKHRQTGELYAIPSRSTMLFYYC